MTVVACRAFASIVAVAIVASAPALAQAPPMSAEFSLTTLSASHAALEGGAAVVIPSGIYARTSVTAASGLTWNNGTTASASRFEAMSRFLLDPFREAQYGLSLGGGLGVTNTSGGTRWRPYLAFVMDLELQQAGGWTPAIQAGLGAGARLAVVLRSGSGRWR
jgi:hypothetical protein